MVQMDDTKSDGCTLLVAPLSSPSPPPLPVEQAKRQHERRPKQARNAQEKSRGKKQAAHSYLKVPEQTFVGHALPALPVVAAPRLAALRPVGWWRYRCAGHACAL